MLLHEVFAQTVARWPDEPAIYVPGGPTLTYARVDACSARIAGTMTLRPDDLVALALPRCDERLYVAMLAVLRAGGAYTYLDPRWPRNRTDAVLDDARPVLTLDAAGYAHRLESGKPGGAPSPTPRNLAYVIYTSGTTGAPKGVMIEHRSVVNLALSDQQYFGLGPGDRVAQCSSAAYDSSVEEIWMAWATGATLVPLDDETLRSGPDLGAWLARERISALGPPPTLLRMGLCDDPARDLPHLRLLYVGGEALTDDIVELWAPGRWLENGYGPTEATVVALRGRVTPGDEVTIGLPIDGMHAVVMDQELNVLADGEEGELCLGGVGLARGYLGDPELTAAKFVDHPVLGRLYRTGDRVRRRLDGQHVFLGRLDSQVKLRGHRVELADIESTLCAVSGVRDAGCFVHNDQLEAVVVSESAPETIAMLHAARVPSHYVPTAIHTASAIPRSPTSSKIDRRALAEMFPEWVVREVGRTRPSSEAEEELARCAGEVFGRSDIDLDGDFFLDLGGDSVRAAQFVSRLRRVAHFGAVSVRDLYQARTLGRLALLADPRDAVAPRGGAGGRGGELDDPPAWRGESRSRPGSGSADRGASLGVEASSPALFSLAQAAALGMGLGLGSAVAWVLGFVVLPWLLERLALLPLALLLVLIAGSGGVMFTLLWLAVAVVAKRVLIGRYRPGRRPVWGWWHFRHWLVSGLVGAAPVGWLQGTIFHNAVLRLLGAKIGTSVHIDRGVVGLDSGWDLLELGDDVAVGRDAALRTVDLDDGHFVLGPVRVGRGASLDTRAGAGPAAEVGDRAHLGPLAVVPPGCVLGEGRRGEGVPARDVGPAVATDTGEPGTPGLDPAVHGVATLVWRAAFFLAAGLPWWLLFGVALALGLESEHILAWLLRAAPVGSSRHRRPRGGRARGRASRAALDGGDVSAPPGDSRRSRLPMERPLARRRDAYRLRRGGGAHAERNGLLADVASPGGNARRTRVRDQHDLWRPP